MQILKNKYEKEQEDTLKTKENLFRGKGII